MTEITNTPTSKHWAAVQRDRFLYKVSRSTLPMAIKISPTSGLWVKTRKNKLHGHEYGGTNPAMLKALGYGCAILALDTPFNQEMLQKGKHGLYFEKKPQSVSDLISKVEKSPDELNHLRITAREGLTQKYNWDYVTDQYLEVFEELRKGKDIKS